MGVIFAEHLQMIDFEKLEKFSLDQFNFKTKFKII